ncbi:MAG: hypothetical protein HZB41_06255 [Ignavibacteriae bacterium]|nr:hypothetical protein [Ignavibacteriota bacterium]
MKKLIFIALLITVSILALHSCIPMFPTIHEIKPAIGTDTTVTVGSTMLSEIERFGVNLFESKLIYCGIEGNIIHVAYREFSNNMARSAFNQDFIWDLSKGTIIKFRNYTMEVHSADNNIISYKIVSG